PKPGPTQVLIRIRASGLCFTDIHLSQGKVIPLTFPAVLGHEPVGEVVELGSAVTMAKVGDRVGTNSLQRGCGRCEWCQRGKELYCENAVWLMVHQYGSHAEYMLAEARALYLLPENLSFEQAAPLLCAGNTVWSGFREANPLPADRVAVVGIGGLGHLAVQYAKAAGHTVIAMTRSEDKKKLARELGADEVLSDGNALKQAGGADIILSTANSYSVAVDAMIGLRPEGRLVVMGVQEEDMILPERLVFPQMIVNRQKIIASQQNGREFQHEALQIAAAGKVKVYTEAYELAEVQRAVERVAAGKARFRAVFVNAT
ncbi:MAG: alcohol dehydrogenase catalytic domain-containing protein, partial [Pyrinomonadaceae bacterium]